MVNDTARIFYRILVGERATDQDFESYAVKHIRALRSGLQPDSIPNTANRLHMWTGVSVYDSLNLAQEAARTFSLGQFVAQLQIPTADERVIRVEKTGGPGHYTLWGKPSVLRACIQSVNRVFPRRSGGAPGGR